MAKDNVLEISKGAVIGLLFGIGVGLIVDQLLIGVAAGLVLGSGIGVVMSRRSSQY